MSTQIGTSQEILMETKSPIKKVLMVCVILSAVGVFCLIVGLSVVGSNLDGLTQTVDSELKKKTQSPRSVCKTSVCMETVQHLNTTLNLTANPCEDFFLYSCGKYIQNLNKPDDQSRWGQFDKLRVDLKKDITELLNGKSEDYYNQFFKQAITIHEQCSAEVTKDELTDKMKALYPKSDGKFPVAAVADFKNEEFIRYTKASIENTGNGLLNIFVTKSLKSNENSYYMDQPSLGLPKEVYSSDEPNERITAYKTFMKAIATALSGGNKELTEAQNQLLEDVYDFEKKLSKISVPEVDHRDDDKIESVMKADAKVTLKVNGVAMTVKLEELVTKFAEGQFTSAFVVTKPYFDALAAMEVNSLTLVNYFSWVWIKRYGLYINDPTINKAFDDYEMAVKGTKNPTTREDFCSSIVTDIYGMAISSEYVPLKFDKKAKTEMLEMVDNLKASFKGMMKEAGWMEDGTKQSGYAKVDRMITHIGYPDELFDVEGPSKNYLDNWYTYTEGAKQSIKTGANFLESMAESTSFLIKQDFSKGGLESKRSEWIAHPSIVNAFYSPQANSITFPAGILQPPFYRHGRPGYMNYGGIGSVIGHEITHGFDDQGRMRDAVGNKEDWWTKVDAAFYKEKATCFVEQYSGYSFPVGEQNAEVKINGQNTLGENLADNGGLLEAFLAYQQYKEGIKELALPGFEDFTDEKMFFISYAQNWCEVITNQALYQQILTDPHSPASLRVNVVVSNTPQFQEAFGCSKPKSTCKLW